MRKFDADDCAKFKVDMEMSVEYRQAQRKSEWVEEIKKWFLCLPHGHYRFKGKWWREYEVERYYHIIHEKEVAVIYRWGDVNMIHLEYESYGRIKWIIENRSDILSKVRYVGE